MDGVKALPWAAYGARPSVQGKAVREGLLTNQFHGWMLELCVQRGQFEAVFGRQIRQIVVSHLAGSPGMAVQGRQIIRDSVHFSLVSKLTQSLTNTVHWQAIGLFIGTDPQKTEFTDRAKDNAFAGEPGKGLGVAWMGLDQHGQEDVDIQQMLHGKSARSSLIVSRLGALSVSMTVKPSSLTNLNLAGRTVFFTGSRRRKMNAPSGDTWTSKRSPGFAAGKTTRFRESAVVVTRGNIPHDRRFSSFFGWTLAMAKKPGRICGVRAKTREYLISSLIFLFHNRLSLNELPGTRKKNFCTDGTSG